jgi:hypothetical protein
MPVVAPKPQQPNPVEIQNWMSARTNARGQYMDQLARSNYSRSANTANYNTQRQQMQFQQGQQRGTLDDPFIGRGVFRSGIRNQALSDWYTGNTQQMAALQQQYAQAQGTYDLEDVLAGRGMGRTLQNINLAEQARRAQLAAEIRGII